MGMKITIDGKELLENNSREEHDDISVKTKENTNIRPLIQEVESSASCEGIDTILPKKSNDKIEIITHGPLPEKDYHPTKEKDNDESSITVITAISSERSVEFKEGDDNFKSMLLDKYDDNLLQEYEEYRCFLKVLQMSF